MSRNKDLCSKIHYIGSTRGRPSLKCIGHNHLHFSTKTTITILCFRRSSNIIDWCSKATCTDSGAQEFQKLVLRAPFEGLRKKTLIAYILADFPLSTMRLTQAVSSWRHGLRFHGHLLLSAIQGSLDVDYFIFRTFRPKAKHQPCHTQNKNKVLLHWASLYHLSYVSVFHLVEKSLLKNKYKIIPVAKVALYFT